MNTHPSSRPHDRQQQKGMAVIVMLALISILLLYIAANIHSLYRLDREIKLTDQNQKRRLANTPANQINPPPTGTNAVSEAKPTSTTPNP